MPFMLLDSELVLKWLEPQRQPVVAFIYHRNAVARHLPPCHNRSGACQTRTCKAAWPGEFSWKVVSNLRQPQCEVCHWTGSQLCFCRLQQVTGSYCVNQLREPLRVPLQRRRICRTQSQRNRGLWCVTGAISVGSKTSETISKSKLRDCCSGTHIRRKVRICSCDWSKLPIPVYSHTRCWALCQFWGRATAGSCCDGFHILSEQAPQDKSARMHLSSLSCEWRDSPTCLTAEDMPPFLGQISSCPSGASVSLRKRRCELS